MNLHSDKIKYVGMVEACALLSGVFSVVAYFIMRVACDSKK